ncbi:MAG: T9SS type A sorting domain-containing protein [Ferruginibacter sp.]
MEPVQLSIPTPCHESWDKMTPKEKGRYCDSCAKIVVDFSAMTDAQLIQYFENLKTENVCGRVYPDQLNRNLEPAPQLQPSKKFYRYWQYAATFLFFVFKGQFLMAQGQVKVKNTSDTTKKIKEIQDIPIRLGGIRRVYPETIAELPATQQSQLFITDESSKAVSFASVQLLPEGKWIMTDSAGKINLGLNHTVKELKISALGYEEKSVVLQQLKGNKVTLKNIPVELDEVLVKSSGAIKGKMITTVGQVITSTGCKISGISIIKEPAPASLKPASYFTVFPNPVHKGQPVSLRFDAEKPTEYSVQVTDAAGKILLQQNIMLAAKTQSPRLTIPAGWASGQYYISIRSPKEQVMQTAPVFVL